MNMSARDLPEAGGDLIRRYCSPRCAKARFHLIDLPDGRRIKVADLVDDSDGAKRSKVLSSLKDPAQRGNKDHVDIIIALGMAKEGFDWIWCDHALTVGYRSSLTEVIQIIGRATRDAPGKERSRFTNLIAEPDASEALVVDAINDTLKAIAASLLMEQVLAPRFEFSPKNAGASGRNRKPDALHGFFNLQADVRTGAGRTGFGNPPDPRCREERDGA